MSTNVWKGTVAQTDEQPGNWNKQILQAREPRILDAKVPIISAAGPNDKYLGRVVIEFYEIAGAKSDAEGVAYTVEAVNGDHKALARRVAAAFVARLLNGA